MKNNITELVFILDRSGSMSGLEGDTIGGFNSLIEKQKRQEGRCFVTTVLFNQRWEMVHDRSPLEAIRPMTENDYVPGGSTALLDALGDVIRHIAGVHRYARPEDVPEHTVFVIMTDGMENASCRYTADQVRKMISHEQEKYGWEFLFLAANIDAVASAGRIGIGADRAAGYCADSQGTRLAYETVSDAVCCARASKPLAKNWGAKLKK